MLLYNLFSVAFYVPNMSEKKVISYYLLLASQFLPLRVSSHGLENDAELHLELTKLKKKETSVRWFSFMEIVAFYSFVLIIL